MSTTDEIRADIERTHRELGSDVDALADKVNPAKALHRKTSRVRSALAGVRDRVMGAADDTAHNVGSAAGSAAHAVGDVPHRISAQTRGNPVAVGVIAVAAGWILGSLLPASEPEKRAAEHVKDAAQPVLDDVKEAAHDAAEHLKEPVRDAAESVKEQAREGAETVRAEAGSSADPSSGPRPTA